MKNKLMIMILSFLFILSGCKKEEIKVKTVNDYVNDKNVEFVFSAGDTFTVTGKCTVLTGTVEKGTINENDTVYVVLNDGTEIKSSIKQIMKSSDYYESVDEDSKNNISLCLNDVETSSVRDLWYVAYMKK